MFRLFHRNHARRNGHKIRKTSTRSKRRPSLSRALTWSTVYTDTENERISDETQREAQREHQLHEQQQASKQASTVYSAVVADVEASEQSESE